MKRRSFSKAYLELESFALWLIIEFEAGFISELFHNPISRQKLYTKTLRKEGTICFLIVLALT